MKTFAVLNGATVENIVIADTAETDSWIEYTSANPAYINGTYENGFFYSPQPHASWVKAGGKWNPPTPEPTEGTFNWDESTLSWVPFTPINPSIPYPDDGQLYEWDNVNEVWVLA